VITACSNCATSTYPVPCLSVCGNTEIICCQYWINQKCSFYNNNALPGSHSHKSWPVLADLLYLNDKPVVIFVIAKNLMSCNDQSVSHPPVLKRGTQVFSYVPAMEPNVFPLRGLWLFHFMIDGLNPEKVVAEIWRLSNTSQTCLLYW